jgi:signal transduction histidine kinase
VQHEQELLLTFEDNGRGFDVASALRQQSGIGLSNLRYRVEDALQGKLHIDSSPGRGTTISIEIPGKSLSV